MLLSTGVCINLLWISLPQFWKKLPAVYWLCLSHLFCWNLSKYYSFSGRISLTTMAWNLWCCDSNNPVVGLRIFSAWNVMIFFNLRTIINWMLHPQHLMLNKPSAQNYSLLVILCNIYAWIFNLNDFWPWQSYSLWLQYFCLWKQHIILLKF